MMVVRANTMSFEAASPQLTQRLLDLINERITPVVQSRGTVGEGDLGPFTNIGAIMVGAGKAYYRGVRMSAAEALKHAGLAPLQPFGADDSALRARTPMRAVRWHCSFMMRREALVMGGPDLRHRPERHEQQHLAARAAGAGEPSFQMAQLARRARARHAQGQLSVREDDERIIQDPESLRASSIRQGSAWQAWAQLRDVLDPDELIRSQPCSAGGGIAR